jgi:hypothetical protein
MSNFSQKLRYYFLILFDRQTPLYVKSILAVGLVGWMTWQLRRLLLPWH